jgi:hypothetical protein
MIALPGRADTCALIHDGRLHVWSPAGYTPGPARPDTEVDVLTPRSTVDLLAAGYRPELHASIA